MLKKNSDSWNGETALTYQNLQWGIMKDDAWAPSSEILIKYIWDVAVE